MVVLDGNLPVGRGPGTDYPLTKYISMYARTKGCHNKWGFKPTNFVLAYPTVFSNKHYQLTVLPLLAMTLIHSPQSHSLVSHGKHSLHLYPLLAAILRLPRHAWLYIQTFL